MGVCVGVGVGERERESETKIVPFVTMSKKCFPKLYSYLLTTRLSKSYQDMKPLLKETSGEGSPRRGWGNRSHVL